MASSSIRTSPCALMQCQLGAPEPTTWTPHSSSAARASSRRISPTSTLARADLHADGEHRARRDAILPASARSRGRDRQPARNLAEPARKGSRSRCGRDWPSWPGCRANRCLDGRRTLEVGRGGRSGAAAGEQGLAGGRGRAVDRAGRAGPAREGVRAVPDRLRALGPAAHRHLRRGFSHVPGPPGLRAPVELADEALRLLRRHGRAARGARQHPGPRAGRAAPPQAADRDSRSVRHGRELRPQHEPASEVVPGRLRLRVRVRQRDRVLPLGAVQRRAAPGARAPRRDPGAWCCRRSAPSAARPTARSCRSRPRAGRVLQVPIVGSDPDAGTVTYRDEAGKLVEQSVLDGQAKLQWRPDWAMRWAALERRLRDVRQGSDRFGQALRSDLPHPRRHAARGLRLRDVPRRAGPEDLEVQGQRPDLRRVADLRHQGEPEAVHVPGAAQGQAAPFRRDPAQRRRLLRPARPLSRAERGAALPQPGLAHPRRQARRRAGCRSASPCCSTSHRS